MKSIHLKHFIVTLIFLLNPLSAWPNVAEFFGPAAENMAVGNQFSGLAGHPSNNYAAPAVQAFAPLTQTTFGTSYIQTEFEPITNITTSNTSTEDENTTGSISTEYDPLTMLYLHTSIPILGSLFSKSSEQRLKFGLSLFIPKDYLTELHSGHPFWPEYVMYRARYRRFLTYANLAFAINKYWSFSLGTFVSYQTSSSMTVRQSLSGSTNGSSAQATTQVSPAASGIVSTALNFPFVLLHFTFQQEMKTELAVDVGGLVTNPVIRFSNSINSLAYYDPHILRFGLSTQDLLVNFHGTMEYQMWTGYGTSVIRFKNKSGALQSSNDYEQLSTKNIWIPHLGISYAPVQTLTLKMGVAKRPTPLEGSFSGPGNSIDTDSTIYCAGFELDPRWEDYPTTFNLAYQQHELASRHINKTSGLENGGNGSKVGSPGYNIGGSVKVVSANLNLTY